MGAGYIVRLDCMFCFIKDRLDDSTLVGRILPSGVYRPELALPDPDSSSKDIAEFAPM